MNSSETPSCEITLSIVSRSLSALGAQTNKQSPLQNFWGRKTVACRHLPRPDPTPPHGASRIQKFYPGTRGIALPYSLPCFEIEIGKVYFIPPALEGSVKFGITICSD